MFFQTYNEKKASVWQGMAAGMGCQTLACALDIPEFPLRLKPNNPVIEVVSFAGVSPPGIGPASITTNLFLRASCHGSVFTGTDACLVTLTNVGVQF